MSRLEELGRPHLERRPWPRAPCLRFSSEIRMTVAMGNDDVLEGRKAIAEHIGCHPNTVKSYVRSGAPIRVRPPARGRCRSGCRYVTLRRALDRWLANLEP